MKDSKSTGKKREEVKQKNPHQGGQRATACGGTTANEGFAGAKGREVGEERLPVRKPEAQEQPRLRGIGFAIPDRPKAAKIGHPLAWRPSVALAFPTPRGEPASMP